MICKTCRDAAELAYETEVIYPHIPAGWQEVMAGTEAALLWHKECRGGTWCDCQCKLPSRPAQAAPTLVE